MSAVWVFENGWMDGWIYLPPRQNVKRRERTGGEIDICYPNYHHPPFPSHSETQSRLDSEEGGGADDIV